MSGTMARQIETPAKRIQSACVLAARDGNAADAPPGNGFERSTVVEANLSAEPTKEGGQKGGQARRFEV
jgi:hypothetical protein